MQTKSQTKQDAALIEPTRLAVIVDFKLKGDPIGIAASGKNIRVPFVVENPEKIRNLFDYGREQAIKHIADTYNVNFAQVEITATRLEV